MQQSNKDNGRKEFWQSRAIGNKYEELAAEYLKEKGYDILMKNFYSRFGEIDIVAKDGAYLVFVEVKYRRNGQGGHPLEAVDAKKQHRIKAAARFYFLRHGLPEETACRFDVVGILQDEMIHIENAF